VTRIDTTFANERTDALGQRRRLRIHPPMALSRRAIAAILPHQGGGRKSGFESGVESNDLDEWATRQ